MTLGGNPEEIRAEAAKVRSWAAELVDVRDDVRRGYGVEWVGVAGDRYRDRLTEHSRDVGECREELLDVARALDELADTLEERQAAIRRAAALVEDALAGARGTLNRLWDMGRDLWNDAERAAGEAAERLLDSVDELPPVGDPRWLELADRVGRR